MTEQKKAFDLNSVEINNSVNLIDFEDFQEVPLEFIAQYFKGVLGVKRGGKLKLAKDVTAKKASEIQDVWHFIKKGLVYTSTTNKDMYRYSSHEFGIDVMNGGKLSLTKKGKAFGSCHYDTDYTDTNTYGACKASVKRMYIVFTKDGQYYGRFYIYDTVQGVDIIDGAYINDSHTEKENTNEPRLSALIYSHDNTLTRSDLKKGDSSCMYDGAGYANPNNDYAYYVSCYDNNGERVDLEGSSLEITCVNGSELYECNECGYESYDEDCVNYCDRDDCYYCDDCHVYCEECCECFNANDGYVELSGSYYCTDCATPHRIY